MCHGQTIPDTEVAATRHAECRLNLGDVAGGACAAQATVRHVQAAHCDALNMIFTRRQHQTVRVRTPVLPPTYCCCEVAASGPIIVCGTRLASQQRLLVNILVARAGTTEESAIFAAQRGMPRAARAVQGRQLNGAIGGADAALLWWRWCASLHMQQARLLTIV